MSVVAKMHFVFTIGDTITIPFTVVNNGDHRVTDVTLVFDSFPSGVSYLSSVKDQGTYTTLSRTWAVGNLSVGQTETIWMTFTTLDLSIPVDITGEITNAENADYPGEAETEVAATIALHPGGTSFDGYSTKELLSIYTTISGTFNIEDDSGVSYVLTASNNATIILPAVSSLDDGFFVNIKVVNDNSHTITVDPDGGTTIDGNSTETLTTGDFRKYVLLKTGTPRWMKF